MALAICDSEPAMATLQIEDLPDELYRRIQSLADQDNITLNEVVIHLLKLILQSDGSTVVQQQSVRPISETLQRIRSRPRVNPINFGLPDSTVLLREDRAR